MTAAPVLAAGSLAQSNNPDGYTVAIAPASLFRNPHLQKAGYTFLLVVPESSA